ncbi:MAG: hypothetical protein JSR80_05440 [Verrucomicrobia bacterium]|nr:hypothetical protein [Verrucomicrobiota bacterium]
MRKSLLIFLASAIGLHAVTPAWDSANDYRSPKNLQMHNWVLAQPNGKTITVLDLAKRLEVVFRRTYPQYVQNQEARLQYYQMTWRDMLAQSIDNELILADAEQKEIKISDGDVRKEMDQLFGSNVVEAIDSLGLTWEEAWDMTRSDLIVQQMRGYMITRKAYAEISPEKLQEAYNQYLKANPPQDTWTYQVLVIRDADPAIAEQAALLAKQLLEQKPLSLIQLQKELKKASVQALLRLTPVEERTTLSLATSYRETLAALQVGEVSLPVYEQSKADGASVYRIFALQNHVLGQAPSFDQVVATLKGQLIGAAAASIESDYVTKLRRQYGITQEYLANMIPKNFEPFSL